MSEKGRVPVYRRGIDMALAVWIVLVGILFLAQFRDSLGPVRNLIARLLHAS